MSKRGWPHVDDPVSVGRRLKDARLAVGMSQRELAFQGCTAVYICRIERGDRVPSLQVLRELAQIDNIAAVKQARYEDLAPIEGMDLLAGNDDVLAEVMDMGGTGGICVASNLIGTEMRRVIDDPENRHEIEDGLRDLYKAISVTTNPIPVKTALNMIGLKVGGLRLPLVEASEEERAVIREALERHNLLTAV